MFTGRQLDSSTGLYDFRNRLFSSLLGLFLTRDRLGFPDGPNFYVAYFVPHGVDPTGMASVYQWMPFGAVVEFIDCPNCAPAPKHTPRPSLELQNSIFEACNCIMTASILVNNFPDNVMKYYDNYRLDNDWKSKMRRPTSLERLKSQLRTAAQACQGKHAKPLKFRCKDCGKSERGTDAFVPWDETKDQPIGGEIILCAPFYSNPNSSILIHEIGRMYPELSLGDPNTLKWGDVYLWDLMVGSLCKNYAEIIAGQKHTF